jgi:hypothetical protein
VTLEVGSIGKLGGQVDVKDVEGVWFELFRNVGSLSLAMTWFNPPFRSNECALV